MKKNSNANKEAYVNEIENKENEIEILRTKEQEEIEESEGMLEAEEISEFTHERNLEQIAEKYSSMIEDLEDEIAELEIEIE